MYINRFFCLTLLSLSIVSSETNCAANLSSLSSLAQPQTCSWALESQSGKFTEQTQEERNADLCASASCGDYSKVKRLISSGVDIEAQNKALITACQHGREHVVELLLDNKADVNAVDEAGNTSLITSIATYDDRIISLLLEKNANVNIMNSTGETALSIGAVSYNNYVIIPKLLNAGADYDLVDKSGEKLMDKIEEYAIKNKVTGGIARSYLQAEPYRRDIVNRWRKKIINEIPKVILPPALINLVSQYFQVPHEYTCSYFRDAIMNRRHKIKKELTKKLGRFIIFGVLDYLPDEVSEYVESLPVHDSEKRKTPSVNTEATDDDEPQNTDNFKRIKLSR